ncbi:hypothetical protein PVAG01_00028 [Phlyctema vagabunda]|uniref:Uncharacterized protein n=1 Tax=Phlyctema vagabunda TaxID=108571 RepID=A0ABR4PTC6_9HELO
MITLSIELILTAVGSRRRHLQELSSSMALEMQDQEPGGGQIGSSAYLVLVLDLGHNQSEMVSDSQLHWKPVTLRAPVLGGFVIVSIVLIATLELLAYMSSAHGNQNEGGLVFATDVDQISTFSRLLLLYLPTIIAVLYSMLWSWVDLDVKRLEPWFQLSCTDGALAKDSLLLQYPFDFLPFVPITAFQRKHWGIFISGTTMLVIFWILTPLQSAIFNTDTIVRTTNTTMSDSAALLPIENQTSALNANFFNTAYAISWLAQSLPAFTARDYAAVPFHPVALEEKSLVQTWATNTIAYYTNVTCSPANVLNHPKGYTFDNGKGCSVNISLADAEAPGEHMINFIGFYNSPLLDWYLQNPNCSQEFSNNILALFATAESRVSNGVYSNLTALFCEPSYHAQERYVQVNASNQAIVRSIRTRDLDSSKVSDVLNITNFEYLISIGVGNEKSNFQDSAVLEQYPRLAPYNVTWPLSIITGFAIASNEESIDTLIQPAALQRALEKAHQLLFSIAISVLANPLPHLDNQSLRGGTIEEHLAAIVLVRPISLIVETALAVVVLLIICLGWHSHHQKSHLTRDPTSIEDTMSMTSKMIGDSAVASKFRDNGMLTTTQLETNLSDVVFRLEISSTRGQQESHLIVSNQTSSTVPEASLPTVSAQTKAKPFTPVRPSELSLPVGISFIAILAIGVAAIIFLQMYTVKGNGIRLPSKNAVVLSILENYLPTTFATLLEPFWVILNRILCLLQPFEELRNGNAKRSTSIGVHYTSLPPQLVVWRALRAAGHFLLSAVCVVSVSTNILAVVLSGLIIENPTTVLHSVLTSQSLSPKFSGNPFRDDGTIIYADHFHVAMSNLTNNNSLSAWVGKEYFYLPFGITSDSLSDYANRSSGTLQGFEGSTAGFGVNVTCTPLHQTSGTDKVIFNPSRDRLSTQFKTTHQLENGTIISCYSHGNGDVFNQSIAFDGSSPTGSLSMEVMQTMTSAGVYDSGYCNSLLVAGWVRYQHSMDKGTAGGIQSTFLACTQSLTAARFNVMVDTHGHILTSNKTDSMVPNIEQLFERNASSSTLLGESTSQVAHAVVGNFRWHNNTFTSDWMNSLLAIMSKNGSFVDPSKPVPDADIVAPMIEILYQQLFAILLGLNTHVFAEAASPRPLTAQAVMLETRIFVSPAMCKATVAILAVHLISAVWYYCNRPRRFLPRMPTSIATVIAYTFPSRASYSISRVLSKEAEQEEKYAYGRFIGVDGKTHVGIGRQRYVVPLESQNPDMPRRRFQPRPLKQNQPYTWI